MTLRMGTVGSDDFSPNGCHRGLCPRTAPFRDRTAPGGGRPGHGGRDGASRSDRGSAVQGATGLPDRRVREPATLRGRCPGDGLPGWGDRLTLGGPGAAASDAHPVSRRRAALAVRRSKRGQPGDTREWPDVLGSGRPCNRSRRTGGNQPADGGPRIGRWGWGAGAGRPVEAVRGVDARGGRSAAVADSTCPTTWKVHQKQLWASLSAAGVCMSAASAPGRTGDVPASPPGVAAAPAPTAAAGGTAGPAVCWTQCTDGATTPPANKTATSTAASVGR